MSWSYRPQLDGLRAIAVYLVVAFHAALPTASGGFIGVDLFFVLSGFLVTNVIWNEIDTRGKFALGAFYARRVRRLLPAAVVVIVATCLLQLLITPLPSRLDLVDDARSALLYFANWHFVLEAEDYFAQGDDPSPFLHFWSLSIEEQFYVGFPLVCWLLGGRVRRSEARFALVIGGLFLASVVTQLVLAASNPDGAYYGTHARVYQLLAGALLAVALRHLARMAPPGEESASRSSSLSWAVAGAAGLGGIVLLASDVLTLSPSARGLLATVASVAAIGGLTRSSRSLPSRALARPTVRYLGQISYGTYLWHWPLMLAVGTLLSTSPLYTAAIVALLATALAALSFQILETPVRRAAVLDRVPWPTVAVGLAASIVAATVVVAPVLDRPATPTMAVGASAQTSIDLDGSLAWTGRRVPRDLPMAELAADDGDNGAACAEVTPASCVVVDGPETQPLVVLVGDSHAGVLLPVLRALAETEGFRLSSNIRNKCAWIEGIHNRTEREAVAEPCREQRRDFYDTILPAMNADVVLLTERSRDGATALLTDVVADDAAQFPDESFHQMLLRHATGTVDKITTTGATALIVHSLLTTNGWEVSGGDPLDCLSQARVEGDCAVQPVLPPRLDSLFDYLAVTRPAVRTVEFRDIYCPAVVLCAPIVDDLVAWKDRVHLSTVYLLHLRDALWRAMLDSGAFDGLGLD